MIHLAIGKEFYIKIVFVNAERKKSEKY